MSDIPVAIQTKCDSCGEFFPVDELTFEGGDCLCHSCAEKNVEATPIFAEAQLFYTPLYALYDRSGELLHLTLDLGSPKLWRTLQGNSWWFWSVDKIQVFLFESEDKAQKGLENLIKRLCPLYVNLKDVHEYTEKLRVFDAEDTSLTTVSTKIDRDLDKDITEYCVQKGISRADFFRHAIFNQLM